MSKLYRPPAIAAENMQALMALLDAGVKSLGLQCVPQAAKIVAWLESSEVVPEVSVEATPE